MTLFIFLRSHEGGPEQGLRQHLIILSAPLFVGQPVVGQWTSKTETHYLTAIFSVKVKFSRLNRVLFSSLWDTLRLPENNLFKKSSWWLLLHVIVTTINNHFSRSIFKSEYLSSQTLLKKYIYGKIVLYTNFQIPRVCPHIAGHPIN